MQRYAFPFARQLAAAAALSAVLAATAIAAGAPGAPEATPRVIALGPLAPDVLALVIRDRRVESGRFARYEPRPGDRITEASNPVLTREDRQVGMVFGQPAMLRTFDRVVGEALPREWLDGAETYRLVRADGEEVAATPLGRKSRLSDLVMTGQNQFDGPFDHHIYLKLAAPMRVGDRYELRFADQRVAPASLRYDPSFNRSEAVHISQIGFRPDDPVKVAFASCWMGSAGAMDWPEPLAFRVRDDADGAVVFRGNATRVKQAGEVLQDAYRRDYDRANVYRMDFADLSRPGQYRVEVDGVGCSIPFEIGPDVWSRAFITAARGIFHQRSGIAMGPPCTTFRRPRDQHPADGARVYQSDQVWGERQRPRRMPTEADLACPSEAGAWGGHRDAGDWQRMYRNLGAPMRLLELAEMFPDFVASLDHRIPESGDAMPDAIDEALFGLELYRRTQHEDGGVIGGICPAPGHSWGVTWRPTHPQWAWKPSTDSTYFYAAVAARAARVLQRWSPDLARRYRASALAAGLWGERHWSQFADEHSEDARALRRGRGYRCLAAAALYRLTGDARWHKVFAETIGLEDPAAWKNQETWEPAWIYCRTERDGVDVDRQRRCKQALLAKADDMLAWSSRTAYGWTKNNAYDPVVWGMLSTPRRGWILAWAHQLTGDAKYLHGLIRLTQPGGGANPLDLCYTAGLGPNPVRRVLQFDAWASCQPVPEGLAVGGPADMRLYPKQSPQARKRPWTIWVFERYMYPALLDWPAMESYFDCMWWAPMHEFVVSGAIADNAYAWAYLAARP
jgi:endoglucanase